MVVDTCYDEDGKLQKVGGTLSSVQRTVDSSRTCTTLYGQKTTQRGLLCVQFE